MKNMNKDSMNYIINRRGAIKLGMVGLSTPALMENEIHNPFLERHSERDLISRAIDILSSRKVQFADARYTFSRDRSIEIGRILDTESIHIGIRCLIDGYWGFASSPITKPEEIERLCSVAIENSKANSILQANSVILSVEDSYENGSWTTPVEVDPFSVHPLDIAAEIRGVFSYYSFRGYSGTLEFRFHNQKKSYGSTDGRMFDQSVYRSTIAATVANSAQWRRPLVIGPAGTGWEIYDPTSFREKSDRLSEEMKEDAKLPFKPVDVGRFNMILGAASTANLLSGTIGLATELDRILQYEANATGTSYIDNPAEMLGRLKIGGQHLSVRGNRTMKGGCATVGFDDDGVRSTDFPIITAGILSGVQTTRELSQLITSVPGTSAMTRSTTGGSIKSTGCAHSPSASEAPMPRTANLEMIPGQNNSSLEDLCAEAESGVLFSDMNIQMDFQQSNGFGSGLCYEIKKGKKAGVLLNAGVLFKTTELWNGLKGIGGRSSAQMFGLAHVKGQPNQIAYHSVSSVPAIIENATIIDIMRKA